MSINRPSGDSADTPELTLRSRIDVMTHSQHLLFTGAREDALARLPLLSVAPRLELSRDCISLIGPGARLDVAVLLACEDVDEAPWLLLKLLFDGIEGPERDATVAALRGDRYRHGNSNGIGGHSTPDRLH